MELVSFGAFANWSFFAVCTGEVESKVGVVFLRETSYYRSTEADTGPEAQPGSRTQWVKSCGEKAVLQELRTLWTETSVEPEQ